MIYRHSDIGFLDWMPLTEAFMFGLRWTLIVLLGVPLLFGCSYTNCTFNVIDAGGGYMLETHQINPDKSTQGAVSSTHEVSPKADVSAIPGM